MKKVSIKIKGGNVSADFTGFHGKTCEQLDEKVRPQELEVEEKELKPEYHQDNAFTETESHEW